MTVGYVQERLPFVFSKNRISRAQHRLCFAACSQRGLQANHIKPILMCKNIYIVIYIYLLGGPYEF